MGDGSEGFAGAHVASPESYFPSGLGPWTHGRRCRSAARSLSRRSLIHDVADWCQILARRGQQILLGVAPQLRLSLRDVCAGHWDALRAGSAGLLRNRTRNGPRAARSGQRAEPAVTELDRLAMNSPPGSAVPNSHDGALREQLAPAFGPTGPPAAHHASWERQIPVASSLLIYLIPLRPARPSGPTGPPAAHYGTGLGRTDRMIYKCNIVPLDRQDGGPTTLIHRDGHRGPAPLEPAAGVRPSHEPTAARLGVGLGPLEYPHAAGPDSSGCALRLHRMRPKDCAGLTRVGAG